MQAASRAMVLRQLRRFNLEPRALGRSDYPTELPLREVLLLARHCSGGVILGFEQYRSLKGVRKPGTSEERTTDAAVAVPTPWNHLEAGILYGQGLPLLIFREAGVEGGVFDPGVSDVFIHAMPSSTDDTGRKNALGDVFLKWQAEVRRHYYGD
ncbi:MAG: hypothetical protein ABSH51_09425 [Solirubrobacteraceae bacterium]